MPHSVVIDPVHRTARITFRGTVFGEEIVEACTAVFFHPLWERGFSTLWLTEEVVSIVVLPEHVEAYEALSERIRERRGPGRSAVVAQQFNVELTTLMLALKTSGTGQADRSTRLFEDEASAEAWLANANAQRAA